MSIIKRKELVKCPDCGAERYTLAQFIDKGIHLRCKSCSAKAAHARSRQDKGIVSEGIAQFGDVRFGPDIGKPDNRYYVFSACPDCGTTRWLPKAEWKKWGDRRCLVCFQKAKAAKTVARILATHPDIKKIEWRPMKEGKAGYYAVFAPCRKCGVDRWTTLQAHKKGNGCSQCANVKPYGEVRRVSGRGYIRVAIAPDSPFIGMAKKVGGQFMVFEHRLVVAQRERRPLQPDEDVHHLDGDRHNNTPANLQLLSRSDHAIRNSLCAGCPLRSEIRLLRQQLRAAGLLGDE